MSRGFVKEDDSLPPPIIPARAPLPPNTPNYVTPRGLELLRAELTALETERTQLDGAAADAQARTQQLLFLNGRISALTTRLSSARVVAPRPDANDVRFGATVTLQPARAGQPPRQLTIVGVDEADAGRGLIAFTAPVARACTGKRVGDSVMLPGARGPEPATIAAIRYDSAPSD